MKDTAEILTTSEANFIPATCHFPKPRRRHAHSLKRVLVNNTPCCAKGLSLLCAHLLIASMWEKLQAPDGRGRMVPPRPMQWGKTAGDLEPPTGKEPVLTWVSNGDDALRYHPEKRLQCLMFSPACQSGPAQTFLLWHLSNAFTEKTLEDRFEIQGLS